MEAPRGLTHLDNVVILKILCLADADSRCSLALTCRRFLGVARRYRADFKQEGMVSIFAHREGYNWLHTGTFSAKQGSVSPVHIPFNPPNNKEKRSSLFPWFITNPRSVAFIGVTYHSFLDLLSNLKPLKWKPEWVVFSRCPNSRNYCRPYSFMTRFYDSFGNPNLAFRRSEDINFAFGYDDSYWPFPIPRRVLRHMDGSLQGDPIYDPHNNTAWMSVHRESTRMAPLVSSGKVTSLSIHIDSRYFNFDLYQAVEGFCADFLFPFLQEASKGGSYSTPSSHDSRPSIEHGATAEPNHFLFTICANTNKKEKYARNSPVTHFLRCFEDAKRRVGPQGLAGVNAAWRSRRVSWSPRGVPLRGAISFWRPPDFSLTLALAFQQRADEKGRQAIVKTLNWSPLGQPNPV